MISVSVIDNGHLMRIKYRELSCISSEFGLYTCKNIELIVNLTCILYCKECPMTSFLPMQSFYLLLISLVLLIHGQQSKGVVRVQHICQETQTSPVFLDSSE